MLDVYKRQSEDVVEHRNSFLNNINENIQFIHSDANQVVANIIDFDDSFLDITDDQTTTWCFCTNFPLSLSYSEEVLFSSLDSSHTVTISLPPSSNTEGCFFTASDPYHQSCA